MKPAYPTRWMYFTSDCLNIVLTGYHVKIGYYIREVRTISGETTVFIDRPLCLPTDWATQRRYGATSWVTPTGSVTLEVPPQVSVPKLTQLWENTWLKGGFFMLFNAKEKVIDLTWK